MKKCLRQSIATTLAPLFFLLANVSSSTQSPEVTLSTPQEIKAEFNSVPCKNDDRLNAVKALFSRMGAPASDMSVEVFKNVENLVIRKQGTSQEKIVIGAHYDKVADGCGAIDNWTGIVTVAHIYNSLKNIPLQKTILFVAFGKEEKGLFGSKAMVAAIPKDQLIEYCEMINIDSFGLAGPRVADNLSSKKLEVFTASLAREMKIQFTHESIYNADADSSSFIARKIPALTLDGLTSQWPTILHTHYDQPSKVNPASVYLGYRLTLALLVRLDGSPCGDYR